MNTEDINNPSSTATEPLHEESTTDASSAEVNKTLFDIAKNPSSTTDDIASFVSERIKNIIQASKLDKKYKIIFLYDPSGEITEYTATQVYNSITKNNKKQDTLLILQSGGGSVEAAYLISKTCKEKANKFAVAVPRKAKSAATLLSLGADEIHMGSMSELGPIDPQINGLPALGLSNAVEYLASLTKQYPEASGMLANYLSSKLDLSVLGYYQRATESAFQYAVKLLENKQLPTDQDISTVAGSLVYFYKDHGFVIDKEEAKKYLGDTIKIDTAEYKLSSNIHQILEEAHLLVRIFKRKNLQLIGELEDGLLLLDVR